MDAIRVNAARLEETLSGLGAIGESPEGMQRIAFSPAEIEARRFVADRMREAGLAVRVDPAGNLIGSRAGSDGKRKPIAMGSHIDAVPDGGKYDGALGVIAAIEVCRTLSEDEVALLHPVEVIAFTNEEGARFQRGLLGSRAMGGLLEEADLEARDEEGRSYVDRLPSVGADPADPRRAAREPGTLAAYFELHVEQGPMLFESKIPIGVVTGITGRLVFSVHVRGFQNHAGTTPMEGRRDALVAAAHVIQAVERVAAEEKLCRVGTVGIVDCRPGAINVIPGEVLLECELRDLAMDRMASGEKRLRALVQEIAAERGLEIEMRREELEHATPTHPRLRETIEGAAKVLGHETAPVPSGAGHDAQAVGRITDIGMIFVPSVDGISHSPREFTPPDDCARGADVLATALVETDRTID